MTATQYKRFLKIVDNDPRTHTNTLSKEYKLKFKCNCTYKCKKGRNSCSYSCNYDIHTGPAIINSKCILCLRLILFVFFLFDKTVMPVF